MISEGNDIANYRLWLLQELTERTRRNPAYSLRAFSKSLGISAPSLSQILSGKRPLSRKSALKIINRLALSPEQGQALIASALGSGWKEALTKLDESAEGPEYEELQLETFRVIADWQHYAILSLGSVRGNQASPTWIAGRLGISPTEARRAFDRLLKLGLVKLKGKGFYQSSKPLAVPTKGMTPAIRKYHQQMLRLAESALADETSPLELFSSVTMAVDEKQLAEARELIRKFRRKVCRVLESGTQERVYTLAIQLFPISRK